jgi:hypothetical protein
MNRHRREDLLLRGFAKSFRIARPYAFNCVCLYCRSCFELLRTAFFSQRCNTHLDCRVCFELLLILCVSSLSSLFLRYALNCPKKIKEFPTFLVQLCGADSLPRRWVTGTANIYTFLFFSQSRLQYRATWHPLHMAA